MKIDIMQLEFIDKNLRLIATEAGTHFGVEFAITSLYRISDNGVHGTLPLRGLDMRCKDKDLGLLVSKHINSRWIYDSKRPRKVCCVFHDAGSGFHLHIQVCNKTKRRA